jgi:hypothetical protein
MKKVKRVKERERDKRIRGDAKSENVFGKDIWGDRYGRMEYEIKGEGEVE